MDIPYTTELRSDTGLYNGKLGIWLFLASEVMLFGGLFSAYVFLRIGGGDTWPSGPEVLSVPLATLNTVLLIASSMTIAMAWASLKFDDYKKFQRNLGFTIALGVAFLAIKTIEYGDKFSHGHFPSTNNFYGIYFLLTGVHFAHIAGGILVLAFHFVRGRAMWERERERFVNRIEVTGLYWHFVDLVWIFLFPTLYLI